MKTIKKISTGPLGVMLFGFVLASATSSGALAESKAIAKPASQSSSKTEPIDREEGHSGSELWTNNCGRCHNKRSPEKFSDASWSVIVHHMRVRANLTGEEERKIREFLESAN